MFKSPTISFPMELSKTFLSNHALPKIDINLFPIKIHKYHQNPHDTVLII